MPDSSLTAPDSRPPPRGCAPAPGAVSAISLPVLPSPRAKVGFGKSRNGRRRVVVLILVHVIFGLHLLHWLWNGETLSPVEPSESMYTLETGVLNAGAIFFALALLATLIFGRFVCGWACHIVALQDLCAWALSRIGVRPKPFRSRLLVFVPLFFACYMFVWPTFKRDLLLPFLRGAWPEAAAWFRPVRPFPGFSAELFVPDFWATFAGPLMAVPFLLVCGFACVYFLGAKGFCAYGCPYGGFFAPLDTLSPGRIVVDHDKCEGCGHCTATCTSNVRVHEEIRDFGMVVSAGCMKCLDCIAVCPNDALAFKFDRPRVLRTRKRGRATSTPGKPKPAPSRPSYDTSWLGEIVLALLFTGAFVTYRGLYGAVPLLMAIGMAACATFILWKAWSALTTPNATFHSFRLRLRGTWAPGGFVLLALAAITLAFTLHGAALRQIQRSADPFDNQVMVSAQAVLTPNREPVPPEQQAAAREAIRRYTLGSSWRIGGVGLASTPEADVRLAWLHSVMGDYASAEAALRRIMARGKFKESLAANLSQVIALQGRPADAEDMLREAVRRNFSFESLRADLASRYMQTGRAAQAEALYREAIARHHNNARSHAQLGAILFAQQKTEEGLAALREAITIDPRFAPAHAQLAAALYTMDKRDEALESQKRAVDLTPTDPIPAMNMARMLLEMGRQGEAREYINLAEQRQKAASTHGAPHAQPELPTPPPSATR